MPQTGTKVVNSSNPCFLLVTFFSIKTNRVSRGRRCLWRRRMSAIGSRTVAVKTLTRRSKRSEWNGAKLELDGTSHRRWIWRSRNGANRLRPHKMTRTTNPVCASRNRPTATRRTTLSIIRSNFTEENIIIVPHTHTKKKTFLPSRVKKFFLRANTDFQFLFFCHKTMYFFFVVKGNLYGYNSVETQKEEK